MTRWRNKHLKFFGAGVVSFMVYTVVEIKKRNLALEVEQMEGIEDIKGKHCVRIM